MNYIIIQLSRSRLWLGVREARTELYLNTEKERYSEQRHHKPIILTKLLTMSKGRLIWRERLECR